MPNLAPIPSGTDPAQVTAMINRNFQALNNEQVTKLYNDASGTPSILIGVDSTGKSVVKVAKTGIDVTAATDAQLAFNSAQNTLKVVQSGTFSMTATAGTSPSATVPISLGYTPAIVANVSLPNAPLLYTPVNYTLFISSVVFVNVNVFVESTQITFQVGLGSGSSAFNGTYNFKYYLLQETAN
jgi:hypothetical protein